MADVLKHYKLKEKPFSLIPNPRYFYLSDPYNTTRQKLIYHLQDRTASLYLVGDVGIGKTSLLRLVSSEVAEDKTIIAKYLGASSNLHTPNQLLRAFCDEFEVKTDRNQQTTQKRFQEFIFKQSEKDKLPLLLIDEAQVLAAPQLRLIHDFLNFVTNEKVLIMFILVGQPLLGIKIARNRSLKSRMYGAKLSAMSQKDLKAMIAFRWRVAGGKKPPFSDNAYKMIHKVSEGIPREAVKLCSNSLLIAMYKDKKVIDADIIKEASKMI